MDKKLVFLSNVAEKMLAIGASVKVAEWIAYQFALESNFGRSRLARVKHNLCGMKVPTYRPSLNVATTGFAQYLSDDDCIDDYILWLSYSKFNVFELRDLEAFQIKLRAMKYCPEADYIDRITDLQKSCSYHFLNP